MMVGQEGNNSNRAVFTVSTEGESIAFGKLVGQAVVPGTVLLLNGDLGAGKTTFTKGIAGGLGIDRVIKSPTYTLIREYPNGRLPLYHMDMYRITEEEAVELGLDDYFNGSGLCVIEWPTQISDLLPADTVTIMIERKPSDPYARRFVLEASGAKSRAVVEAVMKTASHLSDSSKDSSKDSSQDSSQNT